ncbi:MAG: hypothetical protein IV086_18630 [Hyphomonadaceae bacterium]|nr:hypothetical protein [Hyphomonadaceae bacterium]TPW08831.1 MAG: hypothetical protein FD124_109 [Alphaproteobacteria bacterium]
MITSREICAQCTVGYHAPFDRFEQVAVHRNGPTFLYKCKTCGSLWHETLRDAKRATPEEVAALYPGASV